MDEAFYGLWYQGPASVWTEALPVGNGRFGGMVYGGIRRETISMNEDSVWDGTRADRTNPKAYAALGRIREAIFAGEYGEAERAGADMLGVPMTLDSYQPLCDVDIRLSHTGVFRDYRRALDLDRALHTVDYRLEGYKDWYHR